MSVKDPQGMMLPNREDHAPGDYLSVAQVARRLGCSVSLVQKWRRLEWLPATRLGPAEVPVYGYRELDVERFAGERWNRRRGRPVMLRADGGEQRRQAEQAEQAEQANGAAAHRLGAAPPAAFEHASVTGQAPTTPPPQFGTGPQTPGGEAPSQRQAASESEHTSLPAPTPSPGGRLVLWAGDPRQGTALVLARFPAGELQTALGVATVWARRYDDLVLGEAAGADGEPHVLAVWHKGNRL